MAKEGYCTGNLGDSFDVADVGFGSVLGLSERVSLRVALTHPVQAEDETGYNCCEQ